MARKTNRRKPKKAQNDQVEQARAIIRKGDNVLDGLANLRTRSDPNFLLSVGSKVAEHPAYRRICQSEPFPKSIREFSRERFRYLSDYERTAAWISSVLSGHSDEIQVFLKYRTKIELAFYHDEYEEAVIQIDSIEAELGVSLWSIENRLKYLELTDGNLKKSEYIAELRRSNVESVSNFFIAWLGLRINSTLSRAAFDRMLLNDAPLTNGLYYLLHAHNGRFSKIDTKTASQMLFWIDNLPVIDRYELFLTVSSMLVSGLQDQTENTILFSSINKLAERIDDVRLNRMLIVLGKENVSLPKNDALVDVLRYYSSEEYDEAISHIRGLDSGALTPELINVFVRSKLRAKTPSCDSEVLPSSKTISSVTDDLHSLHSFSLEGLEARLRLEKLISVHCNTAWAASLALILQRQVSDERVFKPQYEQTIQGLRCGVDHPLVGFTQSKPSTTVRYLDCLDGWEDTHQAITFSRNLLLTEKHSTDAPRAEKQSQFYALERIFSLARRREYLAAAKSVYSLIARETTDLTKNEMSVVGIKLLLLGGDIYGAVAKGTTSYLEREYYSAILPIRQLVSGLLQQHDEPLHESTTRGQISTAIMFDIHSRYISSEHDVERADAFNDLLKKQGVSHASMLLVENDGYTVEELRYFLKYLAIPNVLDQCLDLQSTKAVEEERVAILLKLGDMLEYMEQPEDEVIKEELRDIRTRQVVRETARKLDESKIYVNIEAIRRSVDVTLKETWNRYHLASQDPAEKDTERLEQIVRSSLGDQIRFVNLNAPSTKRSALFRRMVRELGEQFTTNKEFGLNANLSTNIRHGYVLRELRSPLVSLRLVTNKDSDSGSYLENPHWNERLALLSPLQKIDVQKALADFSEKIDSHIDDLNRRKLRVKSEKSVEGLFIYNLSDASIDQLYRRFSKIDDYDEFASKVFSVFWSATETGLGRVRKHLLNVVQTDLHLAADELENDLLSIAQNYQLNGITSLLPNAKIDLRHAIERVSSWFSLSRDHEYQDYDLQTAFNVGLRTVESYYSDIEIDASFRSNEVHQMKGSTLPFFARLFDLLLDNAGKHGAERNSKLSVSAETTWDEEMLMLTVSNTLKEKHDMVKLEAKIDQINSDYGKEAAKDLVGEEGGSGYPKIWKILRRDLVLQHDLRVFLKDDRFHVEILVGRGAKI